MESERKRGAGDDRLSLKRQRKQLKFAAAQTGAWERCMFRLVRKNRFCNMERCVRSSTIR